MTTQEMHDRLLEVFRLEGDGAVHGLLSAALRGEIATDEAAHIHITLEPTVWDVLGIPRRKAFAQPAPLSEGWSVVPPLPDEIVPTPDEIPV